MAFATAEDVMATLERLVKELYSFAWRQYPEAEIAIPGPLPDAPFQRMAYQKAMSKYGSDKPDLRIKGLVSKRPPSCDV